MIACSVRQRGHPPGSFRGHRSFRFGAREMSLRITELSQNREAQWPTINIIERETEIVPGFCRRGLEIGGFDRKECQMDLCATTVGCIPEGISALKQMAGHSHGWNSHGVKVSDLFIKQP